MEHLVKTMERIIEHFRSYGPVTDKAWVHFRKLLHLHHHHRGDIIHSMQQPCKKIGFILQGVARSYLYNSDGKDFTWFFHYDNENCSAKQFILADYPSFCLSELSTCGFQALSRCQIAWIGYHELMETLQKFPELLAVEKRLIICFYQQIHLRLQSLLTRSAKERLQGFEQEHRALFNIVPHYHIASFLGISPQRLCQLRK